MSIPLSSEVSNDSGQVIVTVPGTQGPPGSTWRVGSGATSKPVDAIAETASEEIKP